MRNSTAAANPHNRWNSIWLFLDSPRIVLICLAALSLLGVFLILYATAVAPWAYSDSTTYLLTAKNLVTGQGLSIPQTDGSFHPLTWYPPFYPLVLAIPQALGQDSLQAARWLNALLFGLTIFICGYGVYRISNSLLLAGSVSGLILTSKDLIQAFSGVMSEGLMIFTGFSGLVLLSMALISPSKKGLPWGAIVLVGMAAFTRYPGIAFIAILGIVMLFQPQQTFPKRLITALGVGVLASLPLAGWLARIVWMTGTIGGRELENAAIADNTFSSYLDQFLATLDGWIPFLNRGNFLVSPEVKVVLLLVALVGIGILVYLRLRRSANQLEVRQSFNWIVIFGGFTFFYILFHALSFTLSSAPPDVNGRLLSPVYISGICLVVGLVQLMITASNKKRLSSLVFLGLSLVSVWYFHGRLQEYLYTGHNYGDGYTSRRWLETDLLPEVARLNPDTTLASNDPSLILFYTGRQPYSFGCENQDLQLPGIPLGPKYLVLFRPQVEWAFGEQADTCFASFADRYLLVEEFDEGWIYFSTE